MTSLSPLQAIENIEYYSIFDSLDNIAIGTQNIAVGTQSRISRDNSVSVIIPSYQSKDTIKIAIDSLTRQTLVNHQLLIVNDELQDEGFGLNNIEFTLESSLKIYSLHTNQGAYGARNHGLKHAKGDFITVHDADDWSHPQKLEMQIKALLDNPKAVASVSHWARCTTDMQFETRPDGSIVHRNISSLMIRREVFERLGYWDRVSVNADTEYYYRILAAYGPDSIVEGRCFLNH
ncbi:glycosyltransferase family A protein [Shewanella sp. NIFS-20-20]|uniref:glycosyltransferase family 2 protein n=1 Tax=Shewanella sp. NIFS-20-20 TaxID=2853806 RepID=UPI001C443BE6|nr:glycosyltransferase family A protein [Shewanella sp. NIFS-20-20]MBV7317638.1 glycosyltransferase family 2 protein [Shewanella sp. NIFS-20-20]